MKMPFDPSDPLLRSLAEEAADLPLQAAGEARRTQALRRRQRRQVALAFTVLFCGLSAWQILEPRGANQASTAIRLPPTSPTTTAQPPLRPSKYVLVRTGDQARNEPLPMPDGITADQAGVVAAARGLPLLLVLDRSGKVARIHIVER
jgi:hypothetical protein